MRKRLLIGILLLVTATVAYHFYAASNAEQALEESIRTVAAESELNLTVNFSSLDINPFTGDIRISDINIIGDEIIQRGASARLDLTYSDFLFFMIWGTEAGLKQVEEGLLELHNISHTNRITFEELKAEQVTVNYSGNLWNLIILGITGRPAQIQHMVDASGRQLSFSMPSSGIGRVAADSIRWTTHFGPAPSMSDDSLFSSLDLTIITWTPPEELQQSYEFFIQGFGYPTDAIPFQNFSARYNFMVDRNVLSIPEMTLASELFTTTASGFFTLGSDTLNTTRIDSLEIRISDMSLQFQNFVTQLQNLFGVRIPGSGDEFRLSVEGSLQEPQIRFMPQ